MTRSNGIFLIKTRIHPERLVQECYFCFVQERAVHIIFMVSLLFTPKQLLFSATSSSGAVVTPFLHDNATKARQLKEIGDSLSRISKRGESVEYYKMAERLFATSDNPEERADVLYDLIFNLNYSGIGSEREIKGWQDTLNKVVVNNFPGEREWSAKFDFLDGVRFYFQGAYQQSLKYFKESIHKAEGTDIHWSYLVSWHRYLALNYYALYQFDNAIKETKKSLVISQHNNVSPEKTAWDNHMLCVLYLNYAGDLGTALRYGQQALEAYNVNPEVNIDMIIEMYLIIGSIYRKYERPDVALQYFKKAENLSQQYGIRSQSVLKSLYYSIGAFHKVTGNYTRAMDYFNRILNIETQFSRDTSVRTCWHIAQTQYYAGNFEKAVFWANQTLRKAGGLKADPLGFVFKANYILGRIYLEENQLDRALKSLFIARKGFMSVFGERHPWTAYSYSSIAKCFNKKQQYDSALFYIQRALISNLSDFSNPDIYVNPTKFDAKDPDQLILDLDYKAKLLGGRKTSVNEMKIAAKTWIRTAGFIDTLRISMSSLKDKLYYSGRMRNIYDEAIAFLYGFYETTGDIEFMENAFFLSEKAKAAILLNALRTGKAIKFAHVPDDLLKRERLIARRLGILREALLTEQNRENPDQQKIMMAEEGIFKLQSAMDSIIHVLETGYPDYYALKYNAKVASLTEISNKLSEREAMISYHFSQNNIYTFLITPSEYRFNSIPVDSSFSSEVRKVRDYFRLSPQNRTPIKEIDPVLEKISKVLIEPYAGEIRGKHLVIVPDGLLATIPFDLLYSKNTEPGQNLPGIPGYLILQNPISYEYSGTIYAENHKTSGGLFTRMMAVAPDYETEQITVADLNGVRDQDSLLFTPLPYAQEEVRNVRKLLPGRTITGSKATEHFFKSKAPKYDIIHLSMHALLNDRDPLYSKLVFSPEKDTLEDGYLNTWELFNMSLRAKMAVLSACNTGAGQVHQAEGMMSMARGFKYAGVPLLVSTGWEIDDNSGSKLMRLFYRYLREGQSVDIALRNAKISFLKNTDRLHTDPYYWAGLSVIGKPEKILHPWRTLTLVLLVLVLSYFGESWLRKKYFKK